MMDPVTRRTWAYRALFVLLAAALMFVQLLPLDTTPHRVPGPDLLLCLAFAWVQRRPDYVPPLLLVSVFLAADLLLMRPPGLWTALVLIGAEFLRSRHMGTGDMPFAAELLFTASAIVAVSFGYLLVLDVTAVVHAGTTMLMVQMLMTIVFYPAVVLVSRLLFNLQRQMPSEPDTGRAAR